MRVCHSKDFNQIKELFAYHSNHHPFYREARDADIGEVSTVKTVEVESEETNEVGTDSIEDADDTVAVLESCHKCHRGSYRYKKESFCQRCQDEGKIQPGAVKNNCSKCRKPKYRTRNNLFCTAECPDGSEETMAEAEETPGSAENMGVMGNILKYFVESNTWT